MLIYLICLFLIISAFTFFDLINLNTKVRSIIYVIIFCALVFTAGSRYGDRDFFNYQAAYQQSPNWLNGEVGMLSYAHMEVGYLFLNSFFKSIGFTFPAFLIAFAFVSILLCFIFFKKYTHFFLIASLLYFSHVFILREMLQIRAGFSVAISMFTIPLIAERKLWKTFIILFFASLFHFVSIFFLIVYFSYPFLNSTKRQILILAVGFGFGGLLGLANFSAIQAVLNNPLLSTYLVDQTNNYSLGLLNPVLIKHIIVLSVLLVNRNFFEDKIPHFKVLLVSYVIAAFWLSAFNTFAIFAGRIATLFSNVEHVLIPSIMLLQKYKIITYVIIIAYCCVAFFSKFEDLELLSFFFNM